MSRHDWSATSLGPLEGWPVELRVTVNLMLRGGSPMALFWGEDHLTLYNDRYRELIQDKHPAALGLPARDVFPELWATIAPIFQRTRAGEAVVLEDFAVDLRRKDEIRRSFFSGSYNPIEDEHGAVVGFLAVIMETTARVEQERERARVFDTTLSTIVDFAYSFDRDGRFLYVNKALLDLWGLKLEQAVGRNFFELSYPDALAARLQSQIQDVIRTRAVVRDETPYVSPSGVEGYYEYIFSPVLGADGAVAVVAGSTRDISRRKKLEQQLKDVQTRMEAALQAGAIGTWTWDPVADRVYADRNLAQFFSISPQEAKGGPIARYFDAIHPDDRAGVGRAVQAALEHGTVFNQEYRLQQPDGTIRWIFARGTVQRDEAGRAVSLPGMVLDITERKELEGRLQQTIVDLEAAKGAVEQQAGALEKLVQERTARLQDTINELEAFSYSVSHDLRAPLRSMRTFAQVLEDDCRDELGAVGQSHINRIIRAGARMDRIIQDVLVYSQIARTDLSLEPVALDDFIAELVGGYPAFHDNTSDIRIERPLPTVWANPAALTQCLSNLLGNAIKFVAAGVRPVVEISARIEGERALIAIRDNGIGIPADARDAIFGMFYRQQGSYEGTGIGLAIVRKAAQRMGGSIRVESEVGRGSTFTVDLAAAPAP